MSRHLDDLKAKHAAELAEAEREEAIFALIPDSVTTPVISNTRKDPDPTQPAAWLSFSEPYGPEELKTFSAEAILTALENAGWTLAPAALVKWNDYRHCPVPLFFTDVPEKSGHYTLTEAIPVASAWARPNQHSSPQLEAYMVAPDNRIYRVAVYSGKLRCHISCRREEYRGGWRFSGPASLSYPTTYNAAPLAVHRLSKAFRDTEQGISGAVYFEPNDLTAAALAHALEAAPPA